MATHTSPGQPHRRLASIADAAEYADVCPRTLRRRIADGTIAGYRMGPRLIRVDLNELDGGLRQIPTAAGGDRHGEGAA